MTNLDTVKVRLYEKKAALVVLLRDGTVREYYHPRVADIVSILKEDETALAGATVADKVIGKVAASLLALAGVKELYADTLSEPAIPVLEKYGVPFQYKNKVPYILNREKSDLCPMERKFRDETDLRKIYDFFITANTSD